MVPLVCEDLAHRQPDVLGFGRLVQKLISLTLDRVVPVARNTIVDPRSLAVVGRLATEGVTWYVCVCVGGGGGGWE
jgi:hypothetical protein